MVNSLTLLSEIFGSVALCSVLKMAIVTNKFYECLHLYSRRWLFKPN